MTPHMSLPISATAASELLKGLTLHQTYGWMDNHLFWGLIKYVK